jgi:hypothetical protein
MMLCVLEARVNVGKLGCLFGALLLISGCGANSSLNSGTHPVTPASAKLSGKLRGGQQPVQGAEVQVYVVGSTGYGTGAQSLASTTTDQNGNFTFLTGSYTCPTGSSLIYLVATGGDPGTGVENPAIALMAALGPCNTAPGDVNINEVTTVASAWALAPFLGPGAQVGTSSTNALGLANAFSNFNNLVDISTGTAPGSAAPSGAVVPVSKVNTLANILAACVNLSASSACNTLFAAATPTGQSAPADTLDAALNIARNPANNIAALFPLSVPDSPFQPSLSIAPSDWTIGVTYHGAGLNHPASISVDASGNVWTANYCGSSNACSSISEFSNTGQPISGTSGFTDGTLWEDYGLAIDVSGNVWVTNEQTSGGGNGNLSVWDPAESRIVSPSGGYSGGGVDFPVGVATDTNGSVWVADLGDSSASKFSNSGSVITASGPFTAGEGPVAVAIDANHNAWFADQSADSGSVTSISSNGSQSSTYISGGAETSGVATDSIAATSGVSGHVWTANFGSSSVSELELMSNGTASVVSTGYEGGGLNHPNGIAVDGAANIWVTNYDSATQTTGATITELQGANGASPGQALSPSTGLGEDAGLVQPYGIAIDASGNVWVSGFGSSTVTQFLGAATPVKTPLTGPALLP